ncbi:MAG: hypothetical protein ACPGUV_08435 [Polyangiales bacterium]
MRWGRRLAALTLALGLMACGDDGPKEVEPTGDAFADYEDGRVSVIGTDPDGVSGAASAALQSGDCVVIGDSCQTAAELGCQGDDPIDVVVDNGQVVDVLCYGDVDQPTVVVDSSQTGGIDVPQNDNGAVLVFDAALDGQPIQGDLSIDANNVTLYGNGPENTIIEGDLVLTGNNTRVRGVTVTGNVTVTLNNASLVLTQVRGNLRLEQNNATIASCQVFGNIESESNNHILTDNGVGGALQLGGNGYQCGSNYAFIDANDDFIVTDDERGATLSCP